MGPAVVFGAIVTLEDVTAEFEAREATERLTHMLDATADYVAVWRPSGEILYVNAATRTALRQLRASGDRGHLSDLIDDEPRQAFVAEALAVLETSDTWRGELPLNVAPDLTIPVSAIGVVRRDDHGEIEWIAMLAPRHQRPEGSRGSPAPTRHPGRAHRARQPGTVQRPARASVRSPTPSRPRIGGPVLRPRRFQADQRRLRPSGRRSCAHRDRPPARARHPRRRHGGAGRRRRVRDDLRRRGRRHRARRAGRPRSSRW